MDSDSSTITFISFSSYTYFYPTCTNYIRNVPAPNLKTPQRASQVDASEILWTRWVTSENSSHFKIMQRSGYTLSFLMSQYMWHCMTSVFSFCSDSEAGTSRLLNQCCTWSICLFRRFIPTVVWLSYNVIPGL